MEEDCIDCKDSIAHGAGNPFTVSDNWKWEVPGTSGALPVGCVDVCESDSGNLLVCLVKDSDGKWTVKGHNPVNGATTALSTDIKFLVVNGEAGWKKLNPSAWLLPDGAISGGKEHYGHYGEIYVGRHSKTKLLGTIFTPDDQNWCFCTPDNPDLREKDGLEVLCVDLFAL